MIKIAVISATRAEYGILKPLIKKLNDDSKVELQFLVTGTHLSEKYGNTQTEIEKDGFAIFKKFPIITRGNTSVDISVIMSNAIQLFARYFYTEKPKCVVILGDRTEMLGICAAAMIVGIPIVHLHGGELTEGAVDDCVRHAITKMAYLHFASTEVYRRRIIQMGESPERVFNVGALGVENVLNVPLLEKNDIYKNIGIPINKKYALVTFHPVTMEKDSGKEQVKNLISAMSEKKDFFFLITKANADVGGDIINLMFEEYTRQSTNTKLVASLGMLRYLSALKHATFVLGNSSSGIIEAPSLGTPTINIGERQKGRLMANSVINCSPTKNDIVKAIEIAEKMEHIPSFLYGDGRASDKIAEIIIKTFSKRDLNLKKKFYDINF